MQAGCHIHARFDGSDNIRDPMLRQEPALIDDADHQRTSALGRRFCDRQIRQAAISATARQPDLANTPFWTPICNAISGFRGELIRHVAQIERVRLT